MLGLFFLWRIDSPRVERFRTALVDRFVPSFQWAAAPVTWTAGVLDNFQSYSRLYEQNQQLREELRQMKAWKEAALQLEQKNARLLDLNHVRLDPMLTHVTGVVLADSGSPVPPIGFAECRRARWHQGRLGDDGRHRSGRPHFGRGPADQPGDLADRQQQPRAGDGAAFGAKGAAVGGQFRPAAARIFWKTRMRCAPATGW